MSVYGLELKFNGFPHRNAHRGGDMTKQPIHTYQQKAPPRRTGAAGSAKALREAGPDVGARRDASGALGAPQSVSTLGVFPVTDQEMFPRRPPA